MKKLVSFLTFVMMQVLGHCQPQIVIAPFYQGCKAAVSYTFDDGLQDQYLLARPELNKRGIRATFAVIGLKVGGMMVSSTDRREGRQGTPCMTWDMLRQLANEGHEVGSHGWEHRNVTKLSGEDLRHEVQCNDTAIFEHTGRFPQSYFYPGNAKSEEAVAFCEQGRVGSRTFQVSIGSKRDSLWLRQWIDTLLARGQWGVGMTHGIAEGYDHFEDPRVLWHHFDYVSTLRDSLWIAPFCEVAAYVKERDNSTLAIKEHTNTITVTPVCVLDSRIFCHPLTLVLKNLHVESVKQEGKALNVYDRGGNQLIDINPFGGDVTIIATGKPVVGDSTDVCR